MIALEHGAARDATVARMLNAIAAGLPLVSELLSELGPLLGDVGDPIHPRFAKLTQELPELVLGIQQAAVAVGLGRFVYDHDLALIPREHDGTIVH